MISKHQKGISKFFKIYMSIFTALLGAAFIVCVLYIFFTGPIMDSSSMRPFTYNAELVGEYLSYLAAPIALYIASAILAYIFYQFFPERKSDFVKPRQITFLRRIKKYDLAEIKDLNNKKVLKRNKIIRLIAYISTGIVVLVSLFVSIWYMKDDKNFLLTDPVRQNVFMFLDVLPFVVISLVWGIACVFVSDITAKQDISILKNEKLFVLDKKLKVLVDDKTDKIIVNVARVAIGVTAITFIVLGVLNGGMRDVFIKAINICTECIGLG